MVKLKDDVNVDSIGREDYENFSDIEKLQVILILLGKKPITARKRIICENRTYTYDVESGEITNAENTFFVRKRIDSRGNRW